MKISSTYIGIGDGKLGQGVYFTRKGETGARQYRKHIANPSTEKQQAQRTKFKAAYALCKWFCKFFEILWTSSLGTRTYLNALMGYTVKNVMQLVGGVWVPDWTKVVFSSGTLPGFDTPGATNPSGQTIIFTWVDNSGFVTSSPDDTFHYAFINTTTYDTIPLTSFKLGNTTQKRSDQTYSFSAPANWTGNDVAVYGCFLSPDGSLSSETQYFATLTLH